MVSYFIVSYRIERSQYFPHCVRYIGIEMNVVTCETLHKTINESQRGCSLDCIACVACVFVCKQVIQPQCSSNRVFFWNLELGLSHCLNVVIVPFRLHKKNRRKTFWYTITTQQRETHIEIPTTTAAIIITQYRCHPQYFLCYVYQTPAPHTAKIEMWYGVSTTTPKVRRHTHSRRNNDDANMILVVATTLAFFWGTVRVPTLDKCNTTHDSIIKDSRYFIYKFWGGSSCHAKLYASKALLDLLSLWGEIEREKRHWPVDTIVTHQPSRGPISIQFKRAVGHEWRKQFFFIYLFCTAKYKTIRFFSFIALRTNVFGGKYDCKDNNWNPMPGTGFFIYSLLFTSSRRCAAVYCLCGVLRMPCEI